MYEVLLERRAERDLRRLPRRVFLSVVERIRALRDDPRPAGCRKIVGSENDWRIRVGAYRVVYEIDDEAGAVRVMRVRHRRDVYRGAPQPLAASARSDQLAIAFKQEAESPDYS